MFILILTFHNYEKKKCEGSNHDVVDGTCASEGGEWVAVFATSLGFMSGAAGQQYVAAVLLTPT